MASQPPAGYSGGTPRATTAPSAQDGLRASNVHRYVVLLDWWLERVPGDEGKIRVAGFTETPQMSRGASSSKGNRQFAGRVFRSSTIVRRKGYTVLEAEDGYLIKICHVLNIPRTRDNGFPQEVCEIFEYGFPIEWQKFVNPNMEPENKHTPSNIKFLSDNMDKLLSDDMDKFLSDNMNKFLSDSFIYSGHAFAGNEDAFLGLLGLRMDMPEETVKPHGSQKSDQHESMQIDASEQEMINSSIRSVSADIPHENMHNCSSEQEMVTLPINSVIAEHLNSTSSDLGSVNLGTAYASPVPADGTAPQFGAVQGSEDNTGTRLRSGRVLGMPSYGQTKGGYRKKKIQHESVPGEGAKSTADLTSHENVCTRRRTRSSWRLEQGH